MLDRSLEQMISRITRQPEDPANWLELAERIRRGGRVPSLGGLRHVLSHLPAACASSPQERALVETFFPLLGLVPLPAEERAPGEFFAERKRLGNGEHLHDTETGMPLFVRIAGTDQVLAWIPPGEFEMGVRQLTRWWSYQAHPARQVSIPRGFFMGVTEVTQHCFEAFGGRNDALRRAPDLPASNLNWYDAVNFCRALTEHVRGEFALAQELIFRLPGDAEWEYACLGGREAEGEPVRLSSEEYEQNINTPPFPVGRGSPNPFGLQDMLDNVEEWCLDNWIPDLATLEDGIPRGSDEDPERGAVVHDGSDFRFLFHHVFHSPDSGGPGLHERLNQIDPSLTGRLMAAYRTLSPEKAIRGGGQNSSLRPFVTRRDGDPAGDSIWWRGFRIVATLWPGPY